MKILLAIDSSAASELAVDQAGLTPVSGDLELDVPLVSSLLVPPSAEFDSPWQSTLGRGANELDVTRAPPKMLSGSMPGITGFVEPPYSSDSFNASPNLSASFSPTLLSNLATSQWPVMPA